jgi:hypothetical protein
VNCSHMDGKNTVKFYDILFQKTNLKEFSRDNMKKEQFPDFISWLNKSNVEILHLNCKEVWFIFVVSENKTITLNIYEDDVLEALSENKTITSLNFSPENGSVCSLNLKNPDSLKFIEKNQIIKSLDLSSVQFNIYQMGRLYLTMKPFLH